ncbi:DUF1634 domain-containing protein [Neomoorella thermoacetica]|uniref:DUF1634 domain-containing protein n=3 Tax=Neomoorella thermoacetica TaxID=1525 RepID=A0A1D7X794_NEOTH|nr:DUF1634 domain-containing protein [Moorella thermoacetica]AKX93114.1 hypothetical protein MOTHE_c02980 [Moorella thermoacetica]AKX95764.1 hypothetical protein MOTHA_c03950 [Moorella thermoacetica]AOQ22786.1 hypothetical protein Maut_00306 [Moorella thermoacetica]APC07462.1 hypothetical protein MTJW_02790 [Moorella thermoacetica]OIQ08676.1 hypothetical protein MOOR_15950 [Moorella thermoacetica]
MAIAGDVEKNKNREYSLDHVVSRVLLAGVLTSVVLMLLGMGLLALNPGLAQANVLPVSQVLKLIPHFHPMALIDLGLLVLLLTPLARVIITGLGFALEGDWLFAAIALLVLVVLVISLAVGSA